MKPLWQCLFFLLPILAVSGPVHGQLTPTPDEKAPLTLQRCIELAQRHSPLVLAAREDIHVFEAKASEAWWAWFPEVKFSTSIGPSPAHRGNAVDGYTDFADLGVLFDLRVEGVLPLFTFGKIAALKRAAKQGVDIAKEKMAIARWEVALRVRKAYHGYQLALALGEILETRQHRMP